MTIPAMKTLVPVLTACAIVGCTATQPKARPSATARPAGEEIDPGLAQRISRICALPPSERNAETAKLKRESGLVLYCGHDDKK